MLYSFACWILPNCIYILIIAILCDVILFLFIMGAFVKDVKAIRECEKCKNAAK